MELTDVLADRGSIQALCSQLPVSDLNKLRMVLNLSVLKCSLPTDDVDKMIPFLDVDNNTEALLEGIRENGSHTFAFQQTNNRNTRLLKALLDLGVSPNLTNPAGWSLLMMAISDTNIPGIKLLIERGANVNHISGNGLRPLSVTSWPQDQYAEVAMTKILLEAGANPNYPVNKAGDTLLTFAIKKGKDELASLLQQYGTE